MGIIVSKKAYSVPQVEVVEVNVQGVLCMSGENEGYTNNPNPDWFGTE